MVVALFGMTLRGSRKRSKVDDIPDRVRSLTSFDKVLAGTVQDFRSNEGE